jgi:vacuolar-type H+-ATPase subunit D/Vma8
MLSPNKQNLLLLKATVKSQKNGLALLNEKRTGLIIVFLQLCSEGKQLEKSINEKRRIILSNYLRNLLLVSPVNLNLSVQKETTIEIKISKKKISGVQLKQINSLLNIPKNKHIREKIQNSLSSFGYIFPKLISLSQLKDNCLVLALEIKKVNRQILNLETKIEETNANLKWIQQSLMEKSNLEKATLIKLFT